MSDQEDCDFQNPLSIPLNVFKRKRQRSQVDDLEYEENEEYLVELSVCSICDTQWTNNGIHGIVGLKCGHVFGKDCIDKHIRTSMIKQTMPTCPICNHTVTKKEPRRIWPNKIIPCNVDDLVALKKESEDADKVISQLEEANKQILEEINEIKFELTLLALENKPKVVNSQTTVQSIETSPSKFIYQHSFSSKNETYRVMDLVPSQDMAVLSVWNKTNSKYGLRKVNLYDPKQNEFIPNHSNQIKDIKNVLDSMVLSTGLDKTLKITSLTSKQVVQSYNLDAPGWSCTTDIENTNIMYCGLTNNTVMVYDIRNTKEYLHKLVQPCEFKTYSPVHSMNVVNKNDTSIIVCSNLIHTYAWKKENDTFEYIPFEFDEDYKSFNTTYRDDVLLYSLRNKTSTRYEINELDSSLKPHMEWYFDNKDHKQISLCRNTHFKRDEQVFICFSENDKLRIRNKQEEVQELIANGPIVDTKYESDQDMLIILTEEELSVFKFC